MEKRKLIVYLLFLLSFAFILPACSPFVSSTRPPDGTTDVATDGAITATFNERMDASTINGTTFTVHRGGSDLPGTVTYDSGTKTATFTPSGLFALATRHTATITTGVRDLAGNAMSENYAWSFAFRDGLWGTAALIETDNTGDALYPQVAMDAGGNAIAVWMEDDGTRYHIWANRYMPGAGWGMAALIETNNAGDADPQVAMDASGNAIAVWYGGPGYISIAANRYVAGKGWGTAALIETDNTGGASYPQVAMDASGNAIAVWQQSEGTRHNIWANRFK